MAAANALTVLVVVAGAVLVVAVTANAVVAAASAVTPVVAARLRPSTGLTGASGPFCLCLLRVSPNTFLSPSGSTCAKIKINSPCLLHLRWVIAYTI